MTPEEKAKELVEKFGNYAKPDFEEWKNPEDINENINKINAKKCALICVDEIIENVTDTEIIMFEIGGDHYSKPRKAYFQEVKQEINKL